MALRPAALFFVIYFLAYAALGGDALRDIRSEEKDSKAGDEVDFDAVGRKGKAEEVPPPDSSPEVESTVVARTLTGCAVQENCGVSGEVLDTMAPTSKENCCSACQRIRGCSVATFGGFFSLCTLYGNAKGSPLKIYEAPEGSPGLQCILT